MKVHLRLHQDGGFSDPEPCDLPVMQEGEQFIDAQGRAFGVTLVEYRFDLDQIHMFCREYPREPRLAGESRLDHPVGITPRFLLRSAIFETTIFGGVSAVLSGDWKVGVGTAVIGLATAVLFTYVAQKFQRHKDFFDES